MIKNIANEKWCEVSNAVLKYEELAPKMKKGINEVILREISEYLKSGGMLEAQNPDELNWLGFQISLSYRRLFTTSYWNS